MNVVVPFTAIHPATAEATVGATRAYVGTDGEAYWRLLRDLWWAGRTFIIVEHDVAPEPFSIPEMWDCPFAWCAVPYPMGEITTTALGCTKFGAALMAEYPSVVAAIAPGQRGWNGLDGVVIGALTREGLSPHEHGPVARHYHEDTETRRIVMTRLSWVGEGTGRYIHEDAAAGIPPTPPADFETDDPIQIAVCLESGLYVVASSADTRAAKKEAKAEADQAKADAKEAKAVEKDAAKAAEAEAEAAAVDAAAAQTEFNAAVGHVPEA